MCCSLPRCRQLLYSVFSERCLFVFGVVWVWVLQNQRISPQINTAKTQKETRIMHDRYEKQKCSISIFAILDFLFGWCAPFWCSSVCTSCLQPFLRLSDSKNYSFCNMSTKYGPASLLAIGLNQMVDKVF